MWATQTNRTEVAAATKAQTYSGYLKIWVNETKAIWLVRQLLGVKKL